MLPRNTDTILLRRSGFIINSEAAKMKATNVIIIIATPATKRMEKVSPFEQRKIGNLISKSLTQCRDAALLRLRHRRIDIVYRDSRLRTVCRGQSQLTTN